MYIGPTMRGIAKKNQTYCYNPEEIIKKAVDVSAFAKYLFVPMDDIMTARKALQTKGTFYHTAYRKIVNDLEGGRHVRL